MSERRETSRPHPTEPVTPAEARIETNSGTETRAFGRLGGTHAVVRRVVMGRLAAGVGGSVLIAACLIVAGTHLFERATTWLHGQPAYQLEFESIALDPPPPPWIKSGSLGLLRRVKDRARWPESLSVPELELDRLAADFQRESPWVAGVRKMTRTDRNKLIVSLDYRRPVAVLRLGKDPEAWFGRRVRVEVDLVLDGDGVILPGDDLETQAMGTLMELSGLVPAGSTIASLGARPGRALRMDSAKREHDHSKEPIREAARLAAFIRARSPEETDTKPAFSVVVIHAQAQGRLILEAQESGQLAMIVWGPAPGSDAPGELSADRKWALLNEWFAHGHHLAEAPYPKYLAFEGDGVVVRTSGGSGGRLSD